MHRYVSLVVFLLMLVPQPLSVRAEDPKPEDNGKTEVKADESKGEDKKDEDEAQLPVPGVATERDVARERSREST